VIVVIFIFSQSALDLIPNVTTSLSLIGRDDRVMASAIRLNLLTSEAAMVLGSAFVSTMHRRWATESHRHTCAAGPMIATFERGDTGRPRASACRSSP